MITTKSVRQMKDELKALYKQRLSGARLHEFDLAKNRELAPRCSKPFVIGVGADWANRKNRIMFVGQETADESLNKPFNGFKASEIDSLIDGETLTDDVKKLETGGSPFWSLFKGLKGSKTDNTSVIWANLCRFDVGSENYGQKKNTSRSVVSNVGNHLAKYSSFQKGILTEEIEILEPTVIVFAIGPRYERLFKDEFDESTWKRPAKAEPFHKLSLTAGVLSGKSIWLTYHPGYLNRIKVKSVNALNAFLDQLKETNTL